MKSLLKKVVLALGITTLFVSAAAIVPSAGTVSAQSNIRQGICDGIIKTGTETCEDDDSENSFAALAKNVINIFSVVVGAVSVIMIIIGGFRYVVSNGDSNGVSGAKNTILYAVIGLVIVLFAQVIVRFVLSNVSPQ